MLKIESCILISADGWRLRSCHSMCVFNLLSKPHRCLCCHRRDSKSHSVDQTEPSNQSGFHSLVTIPTTKFRTHPLFLRIGFRLSSSTEWRCLGILKNDRKWLLMPLRTNNYIHHIIKFSSLSHTSNYNTAKFDCIEPRV